MVTQLFGLGDTGLRVEEALAGLALLPADGGLVERRSLIDELRAVTQNLAALPEKASVASFS